MKYSIERMFDLKGQVAIVAGATGGLGTEICLALNELGVKLVLVGRRMEGLKALEARLNTKNAAVLSISADITSKAKVQDMTRAAAEALGASIS